MIEVLSKEEILNVMNNHSPYKIAQATGISEQTLANYVNGRTDVGGMSLDKVIKITDYYLSLENNN
ncbi:helix-turn-helix domain-containing protein [Streptococcus loxodontisalivarius]|uniref:Transcriptional regulator with XRE-family HTH domain n=1 Tax=Streptococcus loxodontisalivarius TaxID=1349415 RepID=A0ABS2PRI6_9STRE|nr:helix-turn-helix transcriptional regulator [Streptococcus loxodontisalivarius]MBM7642165.1 transcriptional regulator with XRE-family HTH domain [Streptococcus loxodontisalivarius]